MQISTEIGLIGVRSKQTRLDGVEGWEGDHFHWSILVTPLIDPSNWPLYLTLFIWHLQLKHQMHLCTLSWPPQSDWFLWLTLGLIPWLQVHLIKNIDALIKPVYRKFVLSQLVSKVNNSSQISAGVIHWEEGVGVGMFTCVKKISDSQSDDYVELPLRYLFWFATSAVYLINTNL